MFRLILFTLFLGIGNSYADTKVVESKPQYLQPLYEQLFKDGQREAVLNYMEIGSFALRHGDLDEAGIAFDNAIRRIEQVYYDDPNAEKARSLWYEEAVKTFKGEPYERVMSYYYRGLIDLALGDIENARAMFTSGLLQDAFAEEQQFRADFAIMNYLSAWTAMKMNAEHLWSGPVEEFERLRPGFPVPNPEHNVLVIVETGKSPRKLADGIDQNELVYRPGKKFKDKQAQIIVGNKKIRLYPVEDIHWQASTRGGRTVDRIINGKVTFAENSRSVGEALSETGNRLVKFSLLDSSATSLQSVGTVASIIGLASKMVSMNINTKADTRYWQSLPNSIHYYSFKSADPIKVSPAVLDKYGNVLPIKSLKSHTFKVGNQYTIVWAKSY